MTQRADLGQVKSAPQQRIVRHPYFEGVVDETLIVHPHRKQLVVDLACILRVIDVRDVEAPHIEGARFTVWKHRHCAGIRVIERDHHITPTGEFLQRRAVLHP